ncbi:hypothetical protein CYMTET_52517 [Cymbomonas tetramitiformis]|uniref:Uncharacterized protein n=1 Tax=Cymbomonas tetramitiformis TaxID=36881 RepID=A0AAE0BJ42_9CHLO|nr:hypothetical protein CYMTET_52517 [Cymbomonas tetramitiformis]
MFTFTQAVTGVGVSVCIPNRGVSSRAGTPTMIRTATPAAGLTTKRVLPPQRSPVRRCKGASLNTPQKTPAPRAQSNEGDMELAVFRFTLGIPGLDDEQIPRIVGFIGGILLLVNRAVVDIPAAAQVQPYFRSSLWRPSCIPAAQAATLEVAGHVASRGL